MSWAIGSCAGGGVIFRVGGPTLDTIQVFITVAAVRQGNRAALGRNLTGPPTAARF